MIILTDSAIRDILNSYFTSVKSSPMDNNQTPQTPECVNEDRRAFLGTLAATVATVCRQGFWDQWWPKLRESLAHLVG